ncbi:MAG TPA: hypothetical protein VFX41_00660, partial [Actinomycetales bacterium]|nr:hypothetical protein [Actinomycetales bacterium]
SPEHVVMPDGVARHSGLMDVPPGSAVPPAEMAAHIHSVLESAGSISSEMSLAGSGLYVTMEESFGEKRGVRLSGNRGGDVVDYLIADGQAFVRVDPSEALLSQVPEWFRLGGGSDQERTFAEQIHQLQLLLALRLDPELIERLDSLVFEGRVGDGNLWRYSGVVPYESLASRLPEATLQAIDVARQPMPMFLFLNQDGVPSHVTYSVMGKTGSQSAAQFLAVLGDPVDLSPPLTEDQ